MNEKLTLALIIFLFFFLFYYIMPTAVTSVDYMDNTIMPYVIITENSFYLDNIKAQMNISTNMVNCSASERRQENYLRLGDYWEPLVNGHYVPTYPILPAIMSLPFYYIYYFIFGFPTEILDMNKISIVGHFTGTALSAIAVLCIWFTLEKIKCKQTDALTLVFGLATLVLSVSGTVNNHLVGLIFIPLSWYFVIGEKNDAKLAGLAAALAVAGRATNIASFFVLLTFVFVKKKGIKEFVLGGLVIFLLLGAYNFFMFGSLLKTGYSFVYTKMDGTPVDALDLFIFDLGAIKNLLAFLISPNRGLFFFSPVLIFSLFGIKKAFAQTDEMADVIKFVGAAALLTILLISVWAFWTGAYRYGYVMVLDVIPYFILMISYSIDEIFADKKLFSVFVALAVVSFIIALIGLGWGCDWYSTPIPVDYAEYRVWDISDLEILRCFR